MGGGVKSIVGAVTDVVKSVTGGETRAEKEAKAAQSQQASLLSQQQAEADAQLKERQYRMARAKRGRSSLLSGTEAGVEQKPLSSKLG